MSEPRAVIGIFHKQAWDDNDYAVNLGSQSFNATRHVLNLSLDAIRALKDNEESTDDIGQRFVEHNGPHYVEIVDSVMEYFGVGSLAEITQEMLDKARGTCPYDDAGRNPSLRNRVDQSAPVPTLVCVTSRGITEFVRVFGGPVNVVHVDLDRDDQSLSAEEIEMILLPDHLEPKDCEDKSLDALLDEYRTLLSESFGEENDA